jgi:hypothetical protein
MSVHDRDGASPTASLETRSAAMRPNFFQQYRGQQKRIQGLDQDQVLLRAGSNPAAIHCAPETTIPARH